MARPTREEISSAIQEELGPDVRLSLILPTGFLANDVEIELYSSDLGEVDQGKLKNRLTRKISRMTDGWLELRVVVTIHDERKEKLQRPREELQNKPQNTKRESSLSPQYGKFVAVGCGLIVAGFLLLVLAFLFIMVLALLDA